MAASYSSWGLVRQATVGHGSWPRAWRAAAAKPSYRVVIVGGGGHGIATAYYLAKEHGITDVAVLEKGWIGGGNTGRNTTVVRSNYLRPESAAFYDFSLRLYERLTAELNFNIMFSRRGLTTLLHSPHAVNAAWGQLNTLHLNGIDAEILSREELQRRVPLLNFAPDARFPIHGAIVQPRAGVVRHDAVVWGYARGADARGVDIVQNCEVTGIEARDGRVNGVHTRQGFIAASQVVMAVAGSSSLVAATAGIRLPIMTYPLQAMVTEPIKPCLDTVVLSPATGSYVSQSDRGELVIGGGLDRYPSYAQRGSIAVTASTVAGLLEIFPSFSRLKLMRQWAGMVDIIADSSPILGFAPVRGMFINAGWGTGGFKAIPAGGWTTAWSIAHQREHPMIAPFSLGRFARGALIDEAAAAVIAH
ncbi:MAG TPA: sarcosine oxidase subunit beta family protein [Steroidobacteraceae bacterium]|jgi:sarcosine oxidase subunit beta|nr:sarcosine oxidase subunit beta family protein [Steroidobacteraceae bacterium]